MNFVHTVVDDLKDVYIKPEAFENNGTLCLSSIGLGRYENLIHHFIRGPYTDFLSVKDEVPYYTSEYCNLYQDIVSKKFNFFEKLKKDGGIDYKKIYIICSNIIEYLAILLEGATHKFYNIFKLLEPYTKDTELHDMWGNPVVTPYLHIGIDISTNLILNVPEFFKLVKKFKEKYCVKIHILGGITTNHYLMFKDIADYFYIGNLNSVSSDDKYKYRIVLDDNSGHTNFFENIPTYVNYAKLLYDCNQLRLPEYEKYPKLVITDFGVDKASYLTFDKMLLSFALGTDYIISLNVFLHSKHDNNINMDYYTYDTAESYLYNLNTPLLFLCESLQIPKSITKLHYKTSEIIQAPWLNSDIDKKMSNHVIIPEQFI